jgi:hypothetical protein
VLFVYAVGQIANLPAQVGNLPHDLTALVS